MKHLKHKKKIGLIHVGEKQKSGIQILEKLRQYSFEVIEVNVKNGNEDLVNLYSLKTIIVNIGTIEIDFDDILVNLFDKDINVIINEANQTNGLTGVKRQSWERHLLNKVDKSFNIIQLDKKNTMKVDKSLNIQNFNINEVWILAASIGGPESIKNFLAEFTGKEKIIFIIIQHMDDMFLSKMAEQLNSESKLSVINPISGMRIENTQCVVHPGNEYLHFCTQGVIELTAVETHNQFNPCIDDISEMLINNIKGVNIAVFSGMSTDGIKAAVTVKNKGGKVITQSENSCVLSSIVSGVNKKIKVDFNGSPIKMAEYIIKRNLEKYNGK